MAKLGKKPLLTFIATHQGRNFGLGSCFQIEGISTVCIIPSAMLRRNFPQAKTNTRLKIQFYPWEVDVGRTIWFRRFQKWNATYQELYYTFSRRGKIIASYIPSNTQEFLMKALGINPGSKAKYKMVVTAI